MAPSPIREMTAVSPRSQRFTRPRDILLSVALFGAVTGVLLATSLYAVLVVNGARAYVGGQGHWSRAVEAAVYHLDRYAESGERRDLQRFREEISVPLADMRVRRELELDDPDLERVERDLLTGRNHPDDVGALIWLFRRFGHFEHLRQANAVWRESDDPLLALVELGDRIDAAIRADGPGSASIPALRDELAVARRQLQTLGARFSEAMSGGARWIVGVALLAIPITALLLFLAGASVFLLALRRIRRANQTLVETEERFAQITENIHEIFWIVSRDLDRVHYLSPAYESIWRLTREEAYADPTRSTDRIAPEHRERMGRMMAAAAAGSPALAEYRIHWPDGTVRWVLTRAFPIRDADGHVYRIAGITDDITERKEAEEQRERAEARYRTLIEASPYGIFFLNAEGNLVQVNRAAAEMLGRPASDIVGRAFHEFLPEEEVDRSGAAMARLLTGEASEIEQEVRIVRPDGERRTLDAVARTDVAGGRTLGIWAIARDVTDVREQQRHSQLLAAALSSLQEEGVAIIRGDGSYLYSNDAHARIYGYPPGRPPEQGTFAVAPPEEDRAEIARIFDLARRQGGWTGRLWRRRVGDGRAVPVDIILAPMRGMGEDGEDLFLVIVRDVSEDVQRERELRRAERLSGLARVVGGVAHELNNPLTSIKGFADLLLKSDAAAESREDLEVIQREADRAAKIVQDLRLIAGKGRPSDRERTIVDVRDIVRHVARVRAYAAETGGVDLRVNVPDEPLPVRADAGELEQVILNLVQNAEDAVARMERGEDECRITIECRRRGNRIELSVLDTGSGIPHAEQDRLFDPFWTTKDTGTGLGLPIVQGIVRDLSGDMGVDSRPGGPTVFTVDLPLAPAQESSVEAIDSDGRPRPARPLRILVVDDEPDIRTTLRRFLEDAGHTVAEASEGEEALRYIEREGARGIDSIVADLRMPGMNGEEMLGHLMDRWPRLVERLVFITGDAVSDEAAGFLDRVSVPVLLKPFDLERLGTLVEMRAAGA